MATCLQAFKSAIREVDPKAKLVICKDEDVAMQKAVSDVFHDSIILHCVRHLEKNLQMKLRQNGCSSEIVTEVGDAIFKEDT